MSLARTSRTAARTVELEGLRLELQELTHEHRESRRRFDRDLVDRRERFVAATRHELREKLKAERAELRRLRRRRKRMEAATPGQRMTTTWTGDSWATSEGDWSKRPKAPKRQP
jgi:signal transduction histidine kinase